MNPIMLSHCCLRSLKVESSGAGTSFHRCAKCGLAAEPISEAGVMHRLMAMRVDLGSLYAAFHQEPGSEDVLDAEDCLAGATGWLPKRHLDIPKPE